MTRAIFELRSNLIAGFKLISLRELRREDFYVSPDQAILLLFLNLLLSALTDFLVALPEPEFSPYAIPCHGFDLACLFLASYLIARIINNREAVLQLVVIILSSVPLLYGLSALITSFSEPLEGTERFPYFVLLAGYYFLLAVVLMRPVRMVALHKKRFAILGFIVFLTVWIVPSSYPDFSYRFWYANESAQDDYDPYAEYREIDAEGLMYSQAEMLNRSLNALQPGIPGVSDLFFVSFASYAYQDVFLKEAKYTQHLLDKRFGTRGRSIRLINHLATRDQTPLATSTNLAITLKKIGEIMDPEEDVLVLYLTSHGSRNHKLSVRFWPLALNDIDPAMLRTMLDDAGIQWRVIIISACYSGGFVEPLKDAKTLVATAAAADRTSFGCSNEHDFTYFGEAVFKDQLSRKFSFIKAFEQAALDLEQREQQENLTPSKPQLFVGDSIKNKLNRLSLDLSWNYCERSEPEPEPNSRLCS